MSEDTKSTEIEVDDDNKSNILVMLPVVIIPLILCNLSGRQRAQISHVCKLFNNSIKLIINNSIKIHWNEEYNKSVEYETGQEILATHDIYLSAHKLEKNYNNLIKFNFFNIRKTSADNIVSPFYGKTVNGIFYLNSIAFDCRIYVNDIIDLKWNIINLRRFNTEKNFLLKYELGIFIQTSMTASSHRIGSWNIGFVLGSNIFAYHPGFNGFFGGGIRGAARVEGKNGCNNQDMGFVPKCNQLHKFEIFINQNSHCYLKITGETDVYCFDWKHHKSLFINKECTKFAPNTFGIRIENSKGRNKCKRVGQFGDIHVGVGKRDIQTNDMSLCQTISFVTSHSP